MMTLRRVLPAFRTMLLFGFVFLLVTGAGLHAQGLGPPGSGNGGGGTKLNLGALGDINNSTPKVAAVRVLQGTVQDKNGAPVKGATVFLKDDRSKKIRSMTADQTGAFRFVELSRTTDYELWATAQDKKSATKSVTSFETRDDLTRNLKIE